MSKLRRTIFWIHFVAGTLAGTVILVMCVTGAILAFERNIVEIADKEVRRYSLASGDFAPVSRIIVAARKISDANTDPTAVVAYTEPGVSWQVSFGREVIVYVNPFTAEVVGTGNREVRRTMDFLRELHRYLAFTGDARPYGKALTGAANLLFIVLCLTGLFIWAPRVWEWRRLRPKIWLRRTHSGQARDFNLHNTIGFWSVSLLLVIAITATVISYKWAADLLTVVAGGQVEPASPVQNARKAAEGFFVSDESLDSTFRKAMAIVPHAKSFTLRLPVAESAEFSVDEGIYANRFGRSNLVIGTTDHRVLKWEPYEDTAAYRRARSWFRFLHTGEIGGLPGQILAAAASLAGAVLVWTGFAMAFRRLRNFVRTRHR